MKHIITFVLICLAISVGQSQTRINYKAILNDDSGSPIVSTLVAVQFAIYEGSATGTLVYQEDHTVTTNAEGLLILNIGGGNASLGTYDTIDWAGDDHYLNVQVNSGGGLVDLGTTQFLAVPYALTIPPESIGINDLNDGITNSTTIALGADAGLNNSTISGTENTFVGVNAGSTNANGNRNTYVGASSGASSNTGSGNRNVAIGADAGAALTSGTNNVLLGANSGNAITTGSGNVIIGESAGDILNYNESLVMKIVERQHRWFLGTFLEIGFS